MAAGVVAGVGTLDGLAFAATARRVFSLLSRMFSERLCSAGSRTGQPASPVPSGCAASRTTVGAGRWSEVAAPSTAIVPTEIAPTAVQRQSTHQPGNALLRCKSLPSVRTCPA